MKRLLEKNLKNALSRSSLNFQIRTRNSETIEWKEQLLNSAAQLSPRLQRIRKTLVSSKRSSSADRVEAAVALMVLETGKELETLLIQRTERHDDPWSGQIGLPGGRVKSSDPSTKAALLREVVEEVGVDLGLDGEELGPLSLGHPMRRTEMRVQPWVYGLWRKPSVEIGSEVGSAFWVSLQKLPSMQATSRVLIRGEQRSVECFLIDGSIVWGFTYRVLTELLEIPGIL